MIPIIPTIIATKTGLEILQKAKEWFYPDKTLKEAEAILSKRIADDVGSLQEQVRTHRQVLDKLVDQVKADKDLIEKHNEVLIHLSQIAQQVAASQAKSRLISYCAIAIAGLSLLLAFLFRVLK
jgi:CRISPR/Cas system-associated endonuclease Cas1